MVGIGKRDDWHYEMLHYRILGLETTASRGEIRKKYAKLAGIFHSDKLGRQMNEEEKVRWNDITTSYEVLTNNDWKGYYDNNALKSGTISIQCSGCNASFHWNKGYKSNISYHVFCNPHCAGAWEPLNHYTATTHNYPEKSWTPPPPEGKAKRTCPGCKIEQDFDEKWWVRYTSTDTDYCCNKYCLAKFLKQKGIDYKKCEFCDVVKCLSGKKTEGDWIFKHVDEKKLVFCSEEHYFKFINKGAGVGGDGSDDSQKDSPPDPLQSLKNSAITEIDRELLKDPEIENSDLDSSNQNWGADIQNATSKDQINQIKNKVLADIKKKRQEKEKPQQDQGDQGQTKTLDTVRQEAINRIKESLNEQPPVTTQELNNQQWEADIKKAESKDKVKEILDQVLAEIDNKRTTKNEKKQLQDLLAKAKKEENWSNYPRLEAIFNQIKNFYSSDAYREKESEIKEIEKKLLELNPEKFKENTSRLLDRLLKANGLTFESATDATKKAITTAKNDPSNANVKKAEEAIAQNGADNDLKNLLFQVWKLLKKNNPSKKELEKMATRIKRFIIKNSYTKKSYELRKPEVQKALSQLSGEEKDQNTPTSFFTPQKILLSLLVISLIGIGVIVVLIWKTNRRNNPKTSL